MSIITRLRRLEGGDGHRCNVCGYTPDNLVTFDVWTDEPTSPFYRPEPPPEPEHCTGCGRPLTFMLNIAYADPIDWEDTP
jgi:hypothetical protein